MNTAKINFLLFTLLSSFIFSCNQKKEIAADDGFGEWNDSLQHIYQYGICTDSLDMREFQIKTGDNPALIFAKLGFSAQLADSINKISNSILDPTRLKTGMHYYTFSTADSIAQIKHIVFTKSMIDFAVIDLSGDTIRAYPYNKEVKLKRKYVSGTITSSLWNAIKENECDPLLAIKLADVYAWQIDFFDIKVGDSFTAIYNQAYVDDSTALDIASIEGAIFTHQDKSYHAIPFIQDSVFEYYDENGASLRKAFLKAPLDFFRITSRFSNARFHPVLKRYRAHHGVDYAAPSGTPVKSIGSGIVTKKAFQAGGGGNYIEIKHNSIYTTTYMHLAKFAKDITVGKTVQQGEIIAYVGSTGLSTGPHLDFRVYKNGKPINPLQMEAPALIPIKPILRDSFLIAKQQLLNELDSFKTGYMDNKLLDNNIKQ